LKASIARRTSALFSADMIDLTSSTSVDGELLFYAHFLRFCNLDTMNRAPSGCPFSPLDCHYRSARWSWWRTVDRCRIRSRQTATPDRESFPETVT